MSRKIILIKQELLLLVYELNRSGLLAENEKIRPILAQLEKLLLCDLSRSEERFSRNAETDLVCRLLLEKKKRAHVPDRDPAGPEHVPVRLTVELRRRLHARKHDGPRPGCDARPQPP